MRLISLCPPGAGEGAEATRRAGRLAPFHVGTGDELRKAIAAGQDRA